MPSLSVRSLEVSNRIRTGLLIILGSACLTFLILTGFYRLAVAATACTLLVGIAFVNVRWALFTAFVYLSLVGELRRLLLYWTDWSGADPLLLVSPILAIMLMATAFAQKRVQFDTRLAKWVLLLMGIMALQVFNPRQGGLLVGTAGAMFLLVPLLWYWVGQAYADAAILRSLFFRLIVPFSIVAAFYGLGQTFVGIPFHQQQWIQEIGAIITIGEVVRGFSFFTSSIEHNLYLVVSATILWAAWLKERNPAILLFPVLFVAVFMVGSRGPIVIILFMTVVLWAAQGRSLTTWAPRLAVGVLIGIMGLTWSLQQVVSSDVDQRAAPFIQRQSEGLTNPNESTLPGHIWMKKQGFIRGFTEPLGRGLGATTQAAKRFGGSHASTELDITNMFVSLGIGGVVYLIFVVITAVTAVQYWMHTRSLVALCLLGILLVTGGGWLIGNRYFITTFSWFCIGALDRLYDRHRKIQF